MEEKDKITMGDIPLEMLELVEHLDLSDPVLQMDMAILEGIVTLGALPDDEHAHLVAVVQEHSSCPAEIYYAVMPKEPNGEAHVLAVDYSDGIVRLFVDVPSLVILQTLGVRRAVRKIQEALLDLPFDRVEEMGPVQAVPLPSDLVPLRLEWLVTVAPMVEQDLID